MNIKYRAYMSEIIIIINVLVFLIFLGKQNMIYELGGVGYYILVYSQEWYRIFTAMFLHADVAHLSGNMILLFALGDMLEVSLGHVKFLSLYLLTGISATILSLVMERYMEKYIYAIGASGAIYGMLGVLLGVVLLRDIPEIEIKPQKIIIVVIMMIYVGFQNTSVNNFAHIGGVSAGVIIYCILSLMSKLFKYRLREKSYEN